MDVLGLIRFLSKHVTNYDWDLADEVCKYCVENEHPIVLIHYSHAFRPTASSPRIHIANTITEALDFCNVRVEGNRTKLRNALMSTIAAPQPAQTKPLQQKRIVFHKTKRNQGNQILYDSFYLVTKKLCDAHQNGYDTSVLDNLLDEMNNQDNTMVVVHERML